MDSTTSAQWATGTLLSRTIVGDRAIEVNKQTPSLAYILHREAEGRYRLVGTQPATATISREAHIAARREYA